MMTSRTAGSGGCALRRGVVAGLFLALAFTAGVASAGDNAAYVSLSGVPSAMHPGDTATVTVTMRNTGTTTWKTTVERETDGSTLTTTRTTYSLNALGHGWGVSPVAVSASVAPNATRSFRFTITAPQTRTKRDYVFRWQMARDSVVTERPIHARSPGTFGAATPSRTIQVGPDMASSFGNATIPSQEWTKSVRIRPLVLPRATGGNGPLSYALTCSLPNGVGFTSSSKTISGTPGRLWRETTCTWKVTDADANTAASDSDKLTFKVKVVPPDTAPSFGGATVSDRDWLTGQAIDPVTLPGATGGNGTLSYALTCSLPRGVNRSGKRISGRPRTASGPTPCTWTVRDSDANTAASDTDSLTFKIKVDLDTAPSFGDKTIADQEWLTGQAIDPVPLPGATGGNGTLSYALTCSLPRGVNRSGKRISGRPRTASGRTTCTWKVTDADANTAASDTDSLTFKIKVDLDTAPSFGGATVSDQEWLTGQAIAPVTMPKATGGNGSLVYVFACSLPGGLTYHVSSDRKTIRGTPTTPLSETKCTYTVTDSDTNTAASDKDTLSFTIEVELDTAPSFGSETIANQKWLIEQAIAPVTLPGAAGGNGTLSYSLTCSLPGG